MFWTLGKGQEKLAEILKKSRNFLRGKKSGIFCGEHYFMSCEWFLFILDVTDNSLGERL